MPKILSYIEFRYEDGRKQCLRGQDAIKWMQFNKDKLALAAAVDPNAKDFRPTWKWERYDASLEIHNRPGPNPVPPSPPKPNYNAFDEYD